MKYNKWLSLGFFVLVPTFFCGAVSPAVAAPAVAKIAGTLSESTVALPVEKTEGQLLEIAPLTMNDFSVANVHLGESTATILHKWGAPTTYQNTTHLTSMIYEKGKNRVVLSVRNSLPPSLSTIQLPVERRRGGLEKITVTGTDSEFTTERAVKIGDGVESLVRKYGRPQNILRDSMADTYYMVYGSPDQQELLSITVKRFVVSQIDLLYGDAGTTLLPKAADVRPIDSGKYEQRDFRLMGITVGETFEDNKFDLWQRRIDQEGTAFWFYKDYCVWVGKDKVVKRVFLLTNNAYTARGVSIGNRLSTLLGLYGSPDLIEKGGDDVTKKIVDAYYYVNAGAKPAYLVFLVNRTGSFIDDIMLTDSPVTNKQDTTKRYGLR